MISPIRPEGRRKIAVVRIYALAIQLIEIASALKSFPIDGRATFNADPIKGVRNAAKVATNNAVFLLVTS